jgi:hypothetical protein
VLRRQVPHGEEAQPAAAPGDLPREFLVLTKGIVHVYKRSDARADVDLRIKALREELASMQARFAYHHHMRRVPVSVGAAAAAEAAHRGDGGGGMTGLGAAGSRRISAAGGVAGGAGGLDADATGDGASGARRALLARVAGRRVSGGATLSTALRMVRASTGGGAAAAAPEAAAAAARQARWQPACTTARRGRTSCPARLWRSTCES